MENKGFTLVELVIAIFILSVAIFGVYNAFSVIIVLTSEISDRLTAAYLAQEGIEIIRNIRDNNWIKMDTDTEATWIDGLNDCASGCQVDYTTGTTITSPTTMTPWTGLGSYLNISANGFYSYNTGTETKFKRKITITFPQTYIIRVSVIVFWSEKGEESQLEAEEDLYNWY